MGTKLSILALAALSVCGLMAITARAQVPAADPAQTLLSSGSFEGSSSYTMSNGTLELIFLQQGASLASVVLHDDAEKLNPLWNPVRLNRERGRDAGPSSTTGHLICLDGFGPPSPEEIKAGIPMHGEAHVQPFEVRSRKSGTLTEVTLTATLPIVQEKLTRTMRMVDGENVVYVESQLESLVGFDRPVSWVEHATVGPPFVETGVTVFDVSAARARSNPGAPGVSPPGRRLTPDQDFTWPLAHGDDGGVVDMRQVPGTLANAELVTTLMDSSRTLVWTTALNPKRMLVFGYLMRRTDYPWMITWGSYATPEKPVRGMEFGMSPAGRRRAVTMGSLFDTPTYRWLAAKGSISTHFLMFYARVPDGFTRVDDVQMENGQIVIEDHTSNRRLRLQASLTL